MNLKPDVRTLACKFQIAGDFVSAEPFGSGHINDTWRVAVAADACNRAALAKPEIEFALPTGEGVCVINLDTVMPGLTLYDFGDMVRSMTNPAAEGKRDLARRCNSRCSRHCCAADFLNGDVYFKIRRDGENLDRSRAQFKLF